MTPFTNFKERRFRNLTPARWVSYFWTPWWKSSDCLILLQITSLHAIESVMRDVIMWNPWTWQEGLPAACIWGAKQKPNGGAPSSLKPGWSDHTSKDKQECVALARQIFLWKSNTTELILKSLLETGCEAYWRWSWLQVSKWNLTTTWKVGTLEPTSLFWEINGQSIFAVMVA